mmetsp:Transcript_22489/g.48983  ORF Transcript_22489/g.48983 Transcript_22489/m.48983 type:complete len:225 (+) Transcript_22489:260-934(+)|eukprot:CAMPEP_0168740598 /NCGR_PEP_ID=MMETSP0724-20121128/12071_1 /TAXON_ID=265536 /ORGANISM="Amphiprora sp., Strain CCMP467" /LENGTH=224 /DNA_ID=CAMNT_0008788057 /DNA_START=167 /DNA_END=841 /DNA_ORIENTATION=-
MILTTTNNNSSIDHQDDAWNETSTHLVDEEDQSKPVSPASSTRSIRFAECNNEYHENYKKDCDDVKRTWYTAQDLCQFRLESRNQVTVYLGNLKQERGETEYRFSRTLGVLYEAVKGLEYEEYDAMSILTTSRKKKVAQLYRQPESWEWLGLEDHLTPGGHSKDLLHRLHDIRTTVLDVQEEYRDGLWSSEEIGTEMRGSCLHISQPSTLLAQLKARALLLASC